MDDNIIVVTFCGIDEDHKVYNTYVKNGYKFVGGFGYFDKNDVLYQEIYLKKIDF